MASIAATNGKGFQPDTDVHVTLEDQSKINKFAKYNARLEELKDELEVKKTDLKNLEEATEEIELFDEDEQIPFVFGEVFISHNLSKTQELLAEAKEKKNKDIADIEVKSKQIQEVMNDLKAQLYLRFGSNIYLENDE